MSEFHDTGLNKGDYYRLALNDVNSEYDRKQSKRSFFDTKASIEREREIALKKVKSQFYGGGGGGMCE